jgi:hypothetical protein
LTISHTTTMAPSLQLRFQMGKKTRGTLSSRRVQVLQGLEWCLKTSLRSRLMSEDTVSLLSSGFGISYAIGLGGWYVNCANFRFTEF